MNIADIILVVFVGLMILLGFSKGFVKMALSFLSGILALVASLILARPIAAALASLSVFDGARQRIADFFESHADFASQSIAQAIEAMKLPSFIEESLLENFSDTTGSLESGLQVLSENVFIFILTAIVFILLVVGIRVGLYFVEKAFNATFARIKVLNITNRFLGCAFSFLQTVLIVYTVLGIIALIGARMPGLIENIDNSLMVSRLYYNNFLMNIFM